MLGSVTLWYQQEIKQLLLCLAHIHRQQGMKQTHDLRVHLKAIRAVWDHLPYAGTSFGEAYPMLQKLYKKSGQKRDALMMHQRLQTLPAYHKHLWTIRLLKQDSTAAAKVLSNLLNARHTRDSLLGECRLLEKLKPTRKDLLSAWKKLNALPKPNNQQHWHDWRKSLKHQYYLGAALHHSADMIDSLQALQHAIGEWHDWHNAAMFLHRNRLEKPAPNEWLLMQQVALIQEAWAKEIRHSTMPN